MPGNLNYSGQSIGNYLILERLGSGEFGSVYRAQNKVVAERIVAIKVINEKYVSSQQECELFIHEARVLLKLKHPHILPVIDIGEQNDVPYMVLEFARNGSLRSLLVQQSGQPLPPERAITLIEQIGQGLQYAHQQGIVHRDLKPDNILFNDIGEALLADFGIATELPRSTIRNEGAISGTPPYMAPEQFRGIVSKLSDQYALGCIAYELVTGRKLFQANSCPSWGYKHTQEAPTPPRQFNPAIPPAVEQAILRTLAKNRMERFPDVAAFLAALSPATVLAPPPLAMLKSALGETPLGSADLTIGRAPDNVLVLNDPQAGRHHAVIRRQGLGYAITDLNSTNKTFVRGQAILAQVPCTLQSGDSIRIGETVFEYFGENSATPTIAPTKAAEPPVAPPIPPTVAAPSPAAPRIPPTVAAPSPATPPPAPRIPPTVAAPPPVTPLMATPPPAVSMPERYLAQEVPFSTPPPYAPPPYYPTQAPQGFGIQTPSPFTPPPAPKKKRTGLWVALGSAIVLIAIIAAVVLHNMPTAPSLPQLQNNYQGPIVDSNQHTSTMTLSDIQETTGGNIQGNAGFASNEGIDFCGTTSFTGAVKTDNTINFTIAFTTGQTISFSGTISSDNLTLSNGKYTGNGQSGTWTGQNTPATLPELFPHYAGTMDFNGSTLQMTLAISEEDGHGNIQGALGASGNTFQLAKSAVSTDDSITFQISIVDADRQENSTITNNKVTAAASGASPTSQLSGT